MGKLKNRNYLHYGATSMICPECGEIFQGKIIIESGSVYIKGLCLEHGEIKFLREKDASWYLNKINYDKPGTITKVDTKIERRCPYDCGICEDHDQHTCIGLIEVTTNCNLNCEMCYAKKSNGSDLSMDKIEAMMDYYQEAEFGNAEILQISGGEPTLHPNIIDIIKMSQEKKIKYTMLNTNGIRIAEDEEFVKELAQFENGFEVYLQFDGFNEEISIIHRGRNLAETKRKAIANLQKYSVPVTLVVTVSELNINELGDIVKYAMDAKAIRGINFQPVAFYGDAKLKADEKGVYKTITLTEVMEKIEETSKGLVSKKDFNPLPCNVERIAVSYFVKSKGKYQSVLKQIDVRKYLPVINNTLNFELDEMMDSKGLLGCDCIKDVKAIKNIIPPSLIFKTSSQKKEYIDDNTFRITVTSFLDKYNFDMKSAQKECVHVITEDLKRVPFSTYNMIHRGK